jgi:hypothetical protein
MRRISDVSDRPLTWTQPRPRRREYELRAGEELVATLRWGRGSLAVAEAAEGRWAFERAGFWRPRVTARRGEARDACAIFGLGWTGGGTLAVPEGRRFAWSPANIWHTHWAWRAADGGALVRFGSRQGLTRVEGEVEVEPAAVALPHLPLLVPLGWYLLVLLAQDTAESMAGTAGGIVAGGS